MIKVNYLIRLKSNKQVFLHFFADAPRTYRYDLYVQGRGTGLGPRARTPPARTATVQPHRTKDADAEAHHRYRPLPGLASEPLEVQVVEELQRRAVPVADARGPRDLPQPGADHVAYIVQRLQDVKEGH